jgi:hypothetical protein
MGMRVRIHAAAGKRDMQALLRDAHARRLVSIASVFMLCLMYESIITSLKQQLNAKPPPAKHVDATRPAGQRTARLPAGIRKKSPLNAPPPPNAPPKRGRGRPPKSNSAEARAEAEKMKERRHRKNMFDYVRVMRAGAGGTKAALTGFFIGMVRAAVLKTGLVARHVYLAKDVISRMYDDEDLAKVMSKEADKRRKPSVVQFVLANLRGTSTSAMDALRFAAMWIPGHSTFSAACKAFESNVVNNWCPCGPRAQRGTVLSPEQQRATAEAAENAPAAEDEEDALREEAERVIQEEADREPTHRDGASTTSSSSVASAARSRWRRARRRRSS